MIEDIPWSLRPLFCEELLPKVVKNSQFSQFILNCENWLFLTTFGGNSSQKSSLSDQGMSLIMKRIMETCSTGKNHLRTNVL